MKTAMWCATLIALVPHLVSAQTAAADTTTSKWAAPASLSDWANTITYGAQVDAGIVGNPQSPRDGVNYGRLFTDKANRPILNQLVLTLERDTDPNATDYDVGFKFQGMYGSDSRIIHTLGVFDHLIHDRNQIAIEEADVSLHTPWLFSGGIDLKGGIYPSPLGFEVTDPKANPFYSHSYIFVALPYEHFGLLSTSHVNSVLDVTLEIDTGSQTTIADGDNNRRPAGIAGLTLKLLGGTLTLTALTHIGPEDAKRTSPAFANSALRSYNDFVATFKATDKLTFTTEVNYDREDGYHAEGYGAAQYVSYALTDKLTLNGRAEIFRDNNNFFISTPVNNLDYVNAERGYTPANFYKSPGPTTYSELTAGVTYKPGVLPKAVSTFMVRPEIRYDRALNGVRPYDDFKDKGSVTLATDVILGF